MFTRKKISQQDLRWNSTALVLVQIIARSTLFTEKRLFQCMTRFYHCNFVNVPFERPWAVKIVVATFDAVVQQKRLLQTKKINVSPGELSWHAALLATVHYSRQNFVNRCFLVAGTRHNEAIIHGNITTQDWGRFFVLWIRHRWRSSVNSWVVTLSNAATCNNE